MDVSDDDRRTAFSIWIRTGRWPLAGTSEGTEIKFNPWHDPDDGRFTFAGTGRYYGRSDGGGFAGGGGSFGGGGASASGTWPWPDRRTRPSPQRNQGPSNIVRRTAPRSAPRTVSAAEPIARRIPSAEEPPFRRILRNGYEYQIDSLNRTRHVSGQLQLNDAQRRSRTAQARAGGTDRRPSDDGGHYIARRFNGPTEAFNHFAQDANFNRSGYRALENQWAYAKRNGKRVFVRILPVYDRRSRRPSLINVWFTIDNHEESVKFPNERLEASRAKR